MDGVNEGYKKLLQELPSIKRAIESTYDEERADAKADGEAMIRAGVDLVYARKRRRAKRIMIREFREEFDAHSGIYEPGWEWLLQTLDRVEGEPDADE